MSKYLVSLLFLLLPSLMYADKIDDQVLMPSVSIKVYQDDSRDMGGINGSGTIFIVGNNIYVLTAAHVIDQSREVREVDENVNGEIKRIKKEVWKPIDIVQDLYKDNKKIGELTLKTSVAFFNPLEEKGGQDIALLKVTPNDKCKYGAIFDPVNRLSLGDSIIHVGSAYGVTGCFLHGSIMKFDHEMLNSTWTLVDLNSKGGCSGGGVFRKDGNGDFIFIGIVTRSDRAGFTLMKPVQLINQVLNENKISLFSKVELSKILP